MNDLSTLANMAEILGVIIVVGGLFFAVLQMRHLRQQRRELAAIELFRFFGNPSFTRAYKTLLHLPDGLSTADLRTREKNLEDAAMLVSSTMENIGVMTFQRIVPFVIVNNLVGSSVIILWRKLGNWAIELRDELGDEAAFEWFQWLAERLEDYQPRNPHAAYDAHKNWMPAHLRHEI
jgi:hypothetical protein